MISSLTNQCSNWAYFWGCCVLTILRPARSEKKLFYITLFVFPDSWWTADLCPCFHRSPTKMCPGPVSSAWWIVPELWALARKSVPQLGRSCSNLCQIFCSLRTKLFPNSGRSRARLSPISFAPCPLPNLAGTLNYRVFPSTIAAATASDIDLILRTSLRLLDQDQ